MNPLLILAFIVFPVATWANCSDMDTSHKPAYFSARVECGTFLHSLKDPKFTVKGKTYAFAMNLGDMWGECPDPHRGCFRPWYNIKARGNAICKAYGFGPYAKMTDYGAFRALPDEMVSLERNGRGQFSPEVVSINHSRSEYAWAKTIYCHRSYRKR